MKKLTLIFVMLIGLFSLPVIKAQTSAGTMLIGLSSGFNIAGEFSTGSDLMSIGFFSTKYKSNASGYTEPDPDKTTNLNLMPKFGMFVVDNLAVGLDVTAAYSQNKSGGSSNKSTITLLMAGPFVRYYIHANKVLPFIEGSATFGSAKLKDEYEGGSDESKTALHSFGGGLGVAVPLGEKVTLDVMAGYTSLTLKAKKDNPDDARMVMGSFGIKLGFVVFLGGAK
jgi:hypothetical protein